MGMMGRILGAGSAAREVGAAVTGVAEVFVGNRAEREASEAGQRAATLGEFAAEFASPGAGWFDGFVDGLNRLPRPMLALGTLGLFAYAMAEPSGFSVRMQGLALVPEPLWWLLGAIVSFYFGARELHYRREVAAPTPPTRVAITAATATTTAPRTRPEAVADVDPEVADAETADDRASLFGFWRSPPAASSAPDAAPPVVVRAADPHFNAALEEWRRLQA